MSISKNELEEFIYYQENIELLEELVKELNQIYKVYMIGTGDSSKEILFLLDKEIQLIFIEEDILMVNSKPVPCFKIKLNKKLIYEGKDEYGYSKLDARRYSLKTILSEIREKIISEVSLIVRHS